MILSVFRERGSQKLQKNCNLQILISFCCLYLSPMPSDFGKIFSLFLVQFLWSFRKKPCGKVNRLFVRTSFLLMLFFSVLLTIYGFTHGFGFKYTTLCAFAISIPLEVENP